MRRSGDYKYDIQVLVEELAAELGYDDFHDMTDAAQRALYEVATERYWESRA